MAHRLFWLPLSPPVGSADSPLPEGALQSVSEPQRNRLPLQMPYGHLSIAVAMAYHQPLGLDIIKVGALHIITRSVHIQPLQMNIWQLTIAFAMSYHQSLGEGIIKVKEGKCGGRHYSGHSSFKAVWVYFRAPDFISAIS